MKNLTLFGATLATLCSWGCDPTDPAPKTDRAVPSDERAVHSPAAEAPEVGHAPGVVDSPAEPGPAVGPTSGPQTRAEFIAASRRRLDEMEGELQYLETRSKERGKQLRKDIREEKRRLDADLARVDAEANEAWSQMKDGFADALARLEAQIRAVRKDIDPDA